MRRLACRTLDILAVGFLLLCVAMVGLWAASALLRSADPAASPRVRLVSSNVGDVYLVLGRGHLDQWMYTPWDDKWYFSAQHSVWPLVGELALAAVCARWLRRSALVAGVRRRGCCPACGYDLRATPGQCPECGARPREGRV